MTGEMTKLESLQNKLGNICDENVLTYRFTRDQYPIMLTIRPNESPAGQLTMLGAADSEADTGFMSPEASLVFMFVDGSLKIRTSETFNISDALFSKLKNMFIKMHSLWQQHFFHEVMINNLLAINAWPAISYSAEKKDESSSNGESNETVEELDDLIPNAADEGDDECEDGADKGNETMPPLTDDPLIEEAKKLVCAEGKASIGHLQRELKVSYRVAADLVNTLEARGVVGPPDESGTREVLPFETEGGAERV